MTTPPILIFTEQPFLAEGFRCILEDGAHFEFRGVFDTTDAFLDGLRRLQPEVAILDSVSIPDAQFVGRIRIAWRSCKFILWAEEVNVNSVRHAFDLGISGVLSNRSTPDALLAALRRIARGELYFPDLYCTPGELAGSSLTPRERQLAALVAQGLKNKEIATALNLQEGTVKVYLSRIYRRLRVADRFELALLGLQAFFGNWNKGTPLSRNSAYPQAAARNREALSPAAPLRPRLDTYAADLKRVTEPRA